MWNAGLPTILRGGASNYRRIREIFVFREDLFLIIPGTMKKQILALPSDVPEKKFWRPWKWIGLALYAASLLFNRWLPGPIVAAGYLYGIVVIANLLFHAFRYLKNRLFWRVRNRIIGSFIFVGIIPLLLLLGIVYLSAYMVAGQLAGKYLDNSLRECEQQIAEINRELSGQVARAGAQAAFPEMATRMASAHAQQFPRLSARLLRMASDGTLEVLSRYDPQNTVKDPVPYPGTNWLGGGTSFAGLLRQGEAALMACLQPVFGLPGFYLEVTVPLDGLFAERLQREKSIYFALMGTGKTNITVSNKGVRVSLNNSGKDAEREAAKAGEALLPAYEALEARRQSDGRSMVSWGMALPCKNYESGKEDNAGLVLLHVPLAILANAYLGDSEGQGPLIIKLIYALAIMFIVAEIISLIIGITISRRITRSVHDMYQGTLALQKGDLVHRIPVRRKDQLGLLAHSFNQMSASITRLLEEVSEKKRLEQELEIAREVQATLFPKQLPHPRGMTVFGGCEPARVVSGDYYDFIVEDEARLDIVVGDISGKGISAALMMANLQAAMRNQLLAIRSDDPADTEKSLAGIMAELNQQIYVNSPSEKYATLFLSRYDAEAHRLWYCNAGHLPPILLTAQGVQLLEPTGMVIGLLPGASYLAKSVELAPGALLAIFTDGVTEAVNKEDEEFGAERLLDVLQQSRERTPEEVCRFVISRVRDWQGDLPQHDDITLIVAKVG
jgi:phosphoserine phosphatase RsbU/P